MPPRLLDRGPCSPCALFPACCVVVCGALEIRAASCSPGVFTSLVVMRAASCSPGVAAPVMRAANCSPGVSTPVMRAANCSPGVSTPVMREASCSPGVSTPVMRSRSVAPVSSLLRASVLTSRRTCRCGGGSGPSPKCSFTNSTNFCLPTGKSLRGRKFGSLMISSYRALIAARSLGPGAAFLRVLWSASLSA
jgi:hypothetical protein